MTSALIVRHEQSSTPDRVFWSVWVDGKLLHSVGRRVARFGSIEDAAAYAELRGYKVEEAR